MDQVLCEMKDTYSCPRLILKKVISANVSVHFQQRLSKGAFSKNNNNKKKKTKPNDSLSFISNTHGKEVCFVFCLSRQGFSVSLESVLELTLQTKLTRDLPASASYVLVLKAYAIISRRKCNVQSDFLQECEGIYTESTDKHLSASDHSNC